MGYVVVCMVLGFFIGGCVLLIQGTWRLSRRWVARDRMIKRRGTIIRVVRERRHEKTSRMQRNAGANYTNYPVIEFQTPDERTVEFRSESSDRGTPSRFVVGKRIEILYDPDENVSPLINSWSGVWSGPLGMMIASVVFIGCAVVITSLFRDRIMASTFLGPLYSMIQDTIAQDR